MTRYIIFSTMLALLFASTELCVAQESTQPDTRRVEYKQRYDALRAKYDAYFKELTQYRRTLLQNNRKLQELQKQKEAIQEQIAREMARDEHMRELQRQLYKLEQEAAVLVDSLRVTQPTEVRP